MNFIISGKNIDVTPGLKSCIEQKLGKLERYFTPETEIIVTLSVEKERQKIEVTIPVKGHIIRSEQSSNDMYVSIDLVEEVIERQLRKYKNKLVARNQEGSNFKQEFFESEDTSSEDDEIKIIRTKRFLRILQRRDRRSQCCIQEKEWYFRFDRTGISVDISFPPGNGYPFPLPGGIFILYQTLSSHHQLFQNSSFPSVSSLLVRLSPL